MMMTSNNDLTTLCNTAVDDMVESIDKYEVISQEDKKFLAEHKEHLSKVLKHTYQWRTNEQKLSILGNGFHTAHAKFHQAILEQNVQMDQTYYLAKEFKLKQIEGKRLALEIEEIKSNQPDTKNLTHRKMQLDIEEAEVKLQAVTIELNKMKTSMNYRMLEVKGWQEIQEQLLIEMRAAKMTEEEIWDKNTNETMSMFLYALDNLKGVDNSNDGAEVNNLINLARFTTERMIAAGAFEDALSLCNEDQISSLLRLGYLKQKEKQEK